MSSLSTTSVAALVLLALASFATAVGVAARPDQMLVEHVLITGAVQSGEAELRHLVDLRNGVRVWEVDAERVAGLAESHPWVRAAHVEVVWPDTVMVHVEERHAVAVLHMGKALYLDDTGTPFLAARSAHVNLPHLTGFDVSLGQVHPDLPALAVSDALWLLGQLEARGLQSLPISEVAFSATRGFTVHHGQARIVFGHGDLPRQLDRLERLVLEQNLDLTQPTHIDLAPASVAIVRPRDPSVAEGS